MPNFGSGTGTPVPSGLPGVATVINTETPLMGLEMWRSIIGFNPWHFWGLADNTIVPVTSSCNDVVYKHAWQSADRVGREQIIESIKQAEYLMQEHIGYWAAPKHFIETVPWPKYHDKALWNMSHADAQGRWQNVRMKNGYISAIGPQLLESLGTVTVTPADDDGDGLFDNFTTSSIVTTYTNTDNFWLVFNSTDRLDNDIANWRIYPVRVILTAGSLSFKGKYWQLVKPIQYEGADIINIDPTVAANFATTLEVYYVGTDPDGTTYDTSQAALIWETAPYPEWAVCCDCAGGVIDASTDPATIAYGVARAGIRAAQEGIVGVGSATYDATNDVWKAVSWGACRPPERVLVRYRAGYPLANNQMDKAYQVAVARLAAAELARPICACDEANRELYRWQFDLARTGGSNDESYTAVSAADLDNPFGTRRGHVYAWRFVNDRRNLIGFSI